MATFIARAIAISTILSFCLLLLILNHFSIFSSLIIDDPAGRTSRKLEVSHAFINSVYYYPKSKSLGDNAVAFNMAIDQTSHDLRNFTFQVVGTSSAMRDKSLARTQREGIPNCRYTTLTAFTNTVPNLEKLEIEMQGVAVEVPFKLARTSAPSPVIICISPQFVAEQWQIFLMHVHAANRFGAHLHIYITSAITSYFDLMKEYESQGYLTLDFWHRMKFAGAETEYFEPNANVEWRNQAGAQTDCLLQYKEAAEYVAFFDMDDILIPQNYPTYLEEFNNEFLSRPDAVSLFYGRREHDIIKPETLSSFKFSDLFSTLRSSKSVKRGKSVVKPTGYNSTWIYYSQNVAAETKINVHSPTLIHVGQLMQNSPHGFDNLNSSSLWDVKFDQSADNIRDDDVQHFENDLERIRNSTAISNIAAHLPITDFYFQIVFKCYYDAFYKTAFVDKKRVQDCPNADFCVLPQRPDYKCVHSDAKYHSGPHMQPVTFHWTTNSYWSQYIGCYQ